MKKKIYQLVKEDFDYNPVSLIIQEEKIIKKAEEGKSAKGTLFIRNEDNRRMKGVLYTTAPFIQLKERAFSGTEALIDYELLTMERGAGERLSGEIYLITSCGEYKIETELQIIEDEEAKKAGNLFRLANLARKDWTAAVEQYKRLYARRNGGGPASQELEEFLIDGSKKWKIQLSTENKSFYYEPVTESFAESITLKKDCWGYLKINVWSDAEFIQPEHKVIWSDNFIGDQYILEFLLHKEKLHAGKNYGRLYIKTIHQLLTVEVCAVNPAGAGEPRLSKKRRQAALFLIHNYLKYRCSLLEKTVYIKEGLAWKKENQALFSEEAIQLLEIYFMAMDGQKVLAGDLLKDICPKNSVEAGAKAYLEYICTEEDKEKERALSTLRKLQEENPDNGKIAWLWLQIEPEFKGDAEKQFEFIEEYNRSHRPGALFYIELIEALNEKPALLKHLSKSLIAGINWGIRMNMVSDTVLERYVFLADKEETFGKKARKGLKELYRQKPADEVLQAILNIMIQESFFGSQYFPWYEKGILKQLRIRNLYEAYLYSAEDRPGWIIPKQVLTYFTYDNRLTEEGKEKLYAYILRMREADKETYGSYKAIIEEFALKRLSQGAMSRYLTVIYPEVLIPEKLSNLYLTKLAGLLFRQELVCHNPNIIGVYIRHKELTKEDYVPLQEGRADVYLFTENPEISFCDEAGCRYGSSIEYEIQPYMDLSGWQKECSGVASEDTKLLLHLYERIEKYQQYDENANEIRRRVLEISGLCQECQGECMTALIHQYFDKMEEEPLKELLLTVPPELVKEKERPRLIDYCILQGLDERAYILIALWGHKEVPPNRLLRLAGRLLEKVEKKEETLLNLCSYLLEHQRYNQKTLTYLVLYYEGLLNNMYHVWEKAKEAGINTWPLEERLLVQILFTEGHVRNHVQVFESYYREKKDTVLVRAYLNYYAYRYFVKDISLPAVFFELLFKELEAEYSKIMALAWLKKKSMENKLLPKEERKALEYLYQFLNRGEIFAFFQKFKDKVPLENGILNKTFLEYETVPGQKISLFFRIGEREDFKVVPMQELGYGIYGAGFLLFPDEILQYYIIEPDEETDSITESGTMTGGDKELEDSAFGLLGAILAARQLKDDAAMEELMREYMLQSYRKERFFDIL